MGKGERGATAKTLHQGLKDMSPHNAGDPSRKLPTNTSVNSDATRKSVGNATNNLGPREA